VYKPDVVDGCYEGVILTPPPGQYEFPVRKPLSSPAARLPVRRDNRVRIIGGCWRGRKLNFPDGEGLRPTGDRIRETLFNWLAPALPAARCLDLFAGSGALGFEALSRGATSCVLLDRNPQAVKCLQEAKRLLSADGATVIAADGLQWLSAAIGTFDIVFVDPPFADVSLAPAVIVETMVQRGLLAADPWIYVEQPASHPQNIPAGFVQYRCQRAGQVSYSLWRRAENIP
jgi:16S rRNA (guanine966-N2)-methyltransferase